MALTKAGFPPRGGSILGPHPSSMENELVIPTTGSQSIARYHTKRSVLSCHWPRTYYSRYVHVSNLAHFGKHFHGTFWHAHFGIDPRNSTPVLKGDWCAISGTSGQNWQKPFSTNYGTFPIDPKLAGTVPLFYRTTDVHAISAKNGTLGQNWQKPFSTYYGTFPIDPKWQEQYPCSIGRLMCHFCQKWDIGG